MNGCSLRMSSQKPARKTTLALRMYEKTGIPVRKVRQLTSQFLESLAQSLVEGNDVHLHGVGSLTYGISNRTVVRMPDGRMCHRSPNERIRITFRPSPAIIKAARQNGKLLAGLIHENEPNGHAKQKMGK